MDLQQVTLDCLPYLADAEHFITYFCGTAASESTPHLYISSLATWPSEKPLAALWRPQFAKIPLIQT